MPNRTETSPAVPLNERIAHAREVMKKNKLQALLIPTGDPHRTEYLPEHWALRHYLSSFQGSAGTLVITENEAFLWTDFRYWIDAEAKLKNSPVKLKKWGEPKVESFMRYLHDALPENARIGFDPLMLSEGQFITYQKSLDDKKINLVAIDKLCDALWPNRPHATESQIWLFPEKFAGESVESKLKRVREKLAESHADILLVNSLYDIAYLFNLRGNDVPCTPIFAAFALISQDKCDLFVQEKRLSEKVKEKLKADKIILYPYEEIVSFTQKVAQNRSILYAANGVSYALACVIPEKSKRIVPITPIETMRGIKNKVELRHLQEALIEDGAACVNFQMHLEAALKDKVEMDECRAADVLHDYRMQSRTCIGDSFPAIVAYGAHAASCHYAPKPGQCAVIKPAGVLLIDSGGQYWTGTTDMTRTFALGKVSAQYRKDYTLVLKGHLALNRAVFPEGTYGSGLDPLVRQFLWANGRNFGHGTGHGVGFCLNVHEGPHSISSASQTPLSEGMVFTNEPGLYRENEYGIRIENMATVVPAGKTSFGSFLKIKTLTLFPYDQKSLDLTLLTDAEITQINAYHRRVFEALSPKLSAKAKTWLKKATKPIERHG